jgi:hypothetical protein
VPEVLVSSQAKKLEETEGRRRRILGSDEKDGMKERKKRRSMG